MVIFLNEERYLEEAVQSIRAQQLDDWELILVDDGSTDRSAQIARDLAATDTRIRYIDHPGHENRGMSASRNLGASETTAPYIAFLDADDISPTNRLMEQVDLLEKMPDVAMIVGAIRYWYSWDPAATKVDDVVLTGEIADRRLDPPDAALALYPLGPGSPAGVTGLIRRRVFDAVGGFEERFRGLFEDQAFLSKIYMRYPIYISSQAWYWYRQHDASCVGRTSRAESVRLRGTYLAWLERMVGPNGDARVVAAVRRARRAVTYRRLMSPALEVLDRLPEAQQRRLRAMAGRTVE